MIGYYLHNLDPFVFHFSENIGPRWYGLAYVLAFGSSYALLRVLAKRGYADLAPDRVGDFITGCALFGVILGGRLGYVFSTSRKCCAIRFQFCAFGKVECPAMAE